jgi:serine/threonine protein phosphatase 1
MRWIVGDIHGMLRPLELLLDRVGRRDPQAELIFAGDYVNRGPDSKGVVDLLMRLKRARFVRGNHDDTFDLLLNGRCFAPHADLTSLVPTFEHFMKYGLEQTLLSYGIDWLAIDQVRRHPSPQAIAVLLDPIPRAHRDFFRRLPVVEEEDDFFVIHAKWDVDENAGEPSFAQQLSRNAQFRHDVIWGRFAAAEIQSLKPWDRTGFFGHTPVTIYRKDEDILPIVGSKMVLLDTACAVHVDGRLTAWCVEEERWIQVDRHLQGVREGKLKDLKV